LFIDGALMNRQYWNKQDHPIIISKDLHISEEVLDNAYSTKERVTSQEYTRRYFASSSSSTKIGYMLSFDMSVIGFNKRKKFGRVLMFKLGGIGNTARRFYWGSSADT